MTDNEIIKAVECCLNVDSKCADCHFSFERHFCKNALLKQTLDLINRQQQENSNLRSDLTSLKKDLTSAKAEIDSLNKRERILIYHIGVERENAIKDFAGRLKELINPDWCKIHQQIDNLVKEMIGEEL